jgi:large subunit ribosomal protein L25
MVKELQSHPLSGELIHVDFYEFKEDEKIRVSVPVVITGKSAGVEVGGLLQIVRRELEVLCLPMEMPESIEIDVTNLEIGDSVHVDDISAEKGVEILADVNFTVVTVTSPKMVEEPEEEELEEGMAEEAEGEQEGEAPEDEI